MNGVKRTVDYTYILKILLWLIVSVSIDLLALLSFSGFGWDLDTIIEVSLGIISGVSLLGILFFAGAIVFMSGSHIKIEDVNYPKLILKQFLLFLLLSTAYLMVLSIATLNTIQRFGGTGTVVTPEILYGFLLATPFIALVFCFIAAGLVILVDDWRLTLLIGCTLFFFGNLFFGMPSANAQYPGISLFSPSQFYRGIVFLCIEIFTTIPYTLKVWGGLVSPFAMVFPIMFYISLTLISLLIIKVYGKQNLYYRQLQTLTGLIEENEGKHLEAFHLRNQIKSRRTSVFVGFLIVSLLLPITGYTYASIRPYESYSVIYEQIIEPTNGEIFYGSFFTETQTPDTTLWIGFPFIIIDWGQCPNSIQFEHVVGKGTTSDFLSMNENDRWRLSQSITLEPETTEYMINEYTGLDETARSHYWAFRFISDNYTWENGKMTVRISVVLLEKSDTR